DLREYVEVLIKWWREILLLSVLAAVVAGGAVLALELLRTPLYEASATVAMVRVKSDITFDERYRTLSEEDLQALSGATRRSALVGLVLSSSVAEAVLEEVGARLDVAERNPAVLLRMVDAAILTPENGRGESD